jgi:hypothetical protein
VLVPTAEDASAGTSDSPRLLSSFFSSCLKARKLAPHEEGALDATYSIAVGTDLDVGTLGRLRVGRDRFSAGDSSELDAADLVFTMFTVFRALEPLSVNGVIVDFLNRRSIILVFVLELIFLVFRSVTAKQDLNVSLMNASLALRKTYPTVRTA